MLDNIWRYTVNKGEAGGIVIADTQEEAKRKANEMYDDYDGSENTENKITVWKMSLDDDYSEDYPDVLEIYG